jgi:glutathione S-transferase
MITLYGFSISNYYNVVKMALLEKGAAFEEAHTMPRSQDPAVLALSPLGKVPFIQTPEGGMCESQAILRYLETAFPTPALFPAGAYAAGKVQELMLYIDLHLELVARELYAQAFFGGSVDDATKDRVQKTLARNIEGAKKLLKFTPFIAGDTFSMADIVAFNNLPLVGMATRAVYGKDMLLEAGIDYKSYIQHLGQRPSAQKITADRKAAASKT